MESNTTTITSDVPRATWNLILLKVMFYPYTSKYLLRRLLAPTPVSPSKRRYDWRPNVYVPYMGKSWLPGQQIQLKHHLLNTDSEGDQIVVQSEDE